MIQKMLPDFQGILRIMNYLRTRIEQQEVDLGGPRGYTIKTVRGKGLLTQRQR